MADSFRRSAKVVAAGIPAAVVAMACGGTHSSSVLGPAFTDRVKAVCERALAEKKSEPPFPYPQFNPTAPDTAKLPTIGRYEDRGSQIFRSWLQQMNALGQPSTGAARWASLLAALQAHTRIIADQEAAALRSDAKEFSHDYFAGNQAQEQMRKAASAADVPICATAAGA